MPRFLNPHIKREKRTLFDVFLWKTGYYKESKPLTPVPDSFKYPMPKKRFQKDKASAVWINHSSYLIQIGGQHFLTDPIWSKRCSPSPFFGPVRRHEPGIALHELPKIDYVLISHNHYDHLDKKSVLELVKRFPKIIWFVPSGVKKWFTKLGIHQVHELSWWEEMEMGGIKVTATPAQHFSGRSPFDYNSTLWVGWVVEYFGKRFYFAGDTGYNHSDFKKIGEKWGVMDLSLIPIGAYVPRSFMWPVHIDPQAAVKIHQDVHSRLSLGMHWKTFNLSDEPVYQPPFDLLQTLENHNLDPLQFLAPEPGYPLNW